MTRRIRMLSRTHEIYRSLELSFSAVQGTGYRQAALLLGAPGRQLAARSWLVESELDLEPSWHVGLQPHRP